MFPNDRQVAPRLFDVVQDIRREGGAVRRYGNAFMSAQVESDSENRFFLSVDVLDGDDLVMERKGMVCPTAEEALVGSMWLLDEAITTFVTAHLFGDTL